MIAAATENLAQVDVPAESSHPTVWGLDPVQLHDHFWAARGVFVVRLGEPCEIPRGAELYLLTDARTLAVFRLSPIIEILSWVKPAVMFLRLSSRQEQGYRENAVVDDDGRLLRFQRLYGGVLPRLARVALTRDPWIASVWQRSTDSRIAWRQLRKQTDSARRETATLSGRVYDRSADPEVARFVRDLVSVWKYPPATISGVKQAQAGVWAASSAAVGSGARFVGSAWVGAGRSIEPDATVLGPAVLWDDPNARPAPPRVRWTELEPARVLAVPAAHQPKLTPHGPPGKRLFDILFATVALLVTLPIYPLVMLAIWLEDGRPFFFAHRRETLGGREFPCIKFRSMRKDAEKIKASLRQTNQADGPQFYIQDDPRLTRIGRLLRKANIDELPQFINVLLGDMSVVGPRPSPRSENQFSPAWREARLSVRAGVTGLWQVCRTRRPGLDFQEWVKYDLEYVQSASWRMDLQIIWRTIRVLTWG